MTDIPEIIAQVRRDMPNVRAVMVICDELERLMADRPKRDRKEYMRGYMREYRANKPKQIANNS